MYRSGLLLLGLCLQLLISCNPWELPQRKTKRKCDKPTGTISAQPQQKQVDFSISDSSGTIDRVSWNFGNGDTTATLGVAPVRYTYSKSGTYVVTASLTNACEDRTTLQRTVIVSDAVPPVVTLQPVADITISTATARMTVTSTGNATITRYGVCYSPLNPTPEVGKDIVAETPGSIAPNTSAPFSLTGLLPNALYYIRSYAQNSAGLSYSSPVQTFRTGSVPAVVTGVAPSVGVTTASVIFVLNNPGNPAAIQYGVVYSTNSTPDLTNAAPGVTVTSPNVGTNTFVNLLNLTPNTRYYYRSYAKLPSGEIFYGSIQSFTTQVDTVAQDLVAYLPFTNQSLSDASGTGNNANPFNGPTFTEDRKGEPNAAILFDGRGSFIWLKDNASLRPDALSISLWVRPITVTGTMQIYNKSSFEDSKNEMYSSLIKPNENGGPGVTIITDVKQNSNCQPAVGWQSFPMSSAIPLNTWHHVVFTYTGRSARMYFDGALLYTRDDLPASSIDKCPGGDLRFGAQLRQFPQYFNGAMDDIRIYKRAISPAEVQTLLKE